MSILKVSFDLSPVAQEFSLSKEQVDQMANSVSKALTLEIHRNWVEVAKRDLNSTRNQYIRGLVIADEGNSVNTITLTGSLNNMLENGVSAFDMKNGFMKSQKVKYSKTGAWYLTIPFRFATPDALGENEAFSGVLPQEIYDLVKSFQSKKTNVDSDISSKSQTLKSSDIPSQFQAPNVRKSVINDVLNKTFDAYTHKSSIFEGLQKSSKMYEKSNQSSYNTFRRVGENSDSMSWIHSGLQQRNFAQVALDNTDEELIIENTVDKVLSEFGFGE